MPRRSISLTIAVATMLTFASGISAQSGKQEETARTSRGPAPKRDLSGVWLYQGSGGAESTAPEKDMPPMTLWAQPRFATERPGYGTRAVPDGNDPILQCDPTGFPRIMFFPTPYEFVQVSDRIIQFFEREHAWRPIWTDGRSLPKDPDPTWYGYAIGHWEGDYTLVVESAGAGHHRSGLYGNQHAPGLQRELRPAALLPVSYTHLTLPTICSV